MSKAFSPKLFWRFFTLLLMTGCLVFLSSEQAVKADVTCCDEQYSSCMSNCGFDQLCQANCYDEHQYCVASGGEGCGPVQPKTPCEECLDNCDTMYQDCLTSGTQTPQQCAYMNYRCRQRCNLYCIY
jgi:hypothetical protein